MSKAKETQGKRYSQVFLQSDTLEKDSERMRRRLAKCFETHTTSSSGDYISNFIEGELGVSVNTGVFLDWSIFFERAELRDVLDTVTIFCNYLVLNNLYHSRELFLTEVERIFSEERVGYVIDAQGSVFPKFDAQLSKSRQSTIRSLGGEKFNSVRNHLETVDDALLETPINGRGAIRSAFDAVENLTKQKFPKAIALNSKCIKADIKPFLQSENEGQHSEQKTASKILDGFEDWVNACHFYRHADGEPEIKQPSEATTLALVSQGYTYTRWLVEVLKF